MKPSTTIIEKRRMTAAGPTKPSTHSRGSVAHGARLARSAVLREGNAHAGIGAYALPQLGRAFALRALVGLTGEQPESRMCWIHCAYEGTWEGHSEGAFTLNGALFKSCIDTFNAQRNPIPVDYEHASVRSDVLKAPAAGWVQSLDLRGDGLWALVEWTEDAAREIRSGAYRYCSGVFVFDKPDRKSGEPVACSLHSIALTNTPFIDGQKPIALSQRSVALSAGGPMEIDRGALEEALKKLEGDKFTPDQLKALIESVEAMSRAQEPEAASEEVDLSELEEEKSMSEGEPAEAAALSDEPEAEDKALADAPPVDPAAALAELESIAAAMGKDVAGLLAYLREMAATGAGDAAASNPAALKAEVAALKATMQSYGKQLAKYRERDEAEAKAKRAAEQRALSAEVDSMVETGVIVKVDADAWRSLALADAKRFRALKSTLKPAVPTGREASAIAAPTPEQSAVDGPPLDKSDPKVRALYDRFKTVWRETDPVKLDRLVRNALTQSSAG